MTRYEHILNLLPHNMQKDGNAENIKKILKIFAKYLEIESNNDEYYSFLLSVGTVEGIELDKLADMFYIYREFGETDNNLRKRIMSTISKRKAKNTIPSISKTVNNITQSGGIIVRENYNGDPANIYISGDATVEDFDFIYDLVIDMLPVGVRLIVPVSQFGTWQDVLDNSDKWGDLTDNKYIW